ncbi:MAG: PBSX family phage terminase large subunit [Angelakisella sp.]
MYSSKQRALMGLWQSGGLRRINLLEGSVRSGKTWISLVLWAFWVSASPADGCYLMAAKTLGTLKRNCLELLIALVGEQNFNYSLSRKEGSLFGRRIFLEGAGDARAENKIRGMTLAGAYCDELTLFPKDFFAMLLSRISAPGAKLFATTNPDSPEHWLMTDYINRREELDMLVERFLIEDNTFLDRGYVESLKKEYTGVFYDRYILGHWTRAEGLVYPMFAEDRHITDCMPEDGQWYISVDYGTVNPCSMGLWCLDGGKAIRVREYYYSSRAGEHRGQQKTDEEYYEELEKLAGKKNIRSVIVDPSAASFIECIRRHRQFRVRGADNRVVDGIRLVSSLLGEDRLLIHKSCKDWLREVRAYSWEEKGSSDRVVKEFDHAMDDTRYFCSTIMGRLLKREEKLAE